MAILIFDSGIGGLSIRREIQKLLPNLTIHQFADHAWIPYGRRSPSEVTERVTGLIPNLVKQLNIQMVVLACNTASTQTLPELRAAIQCPVIGVVPAIKPACESASNKAIAVLATSSTVNSAYTTTLINDHGGDNQVRLIAADTLVPLAERKLAGEDLTDETHAAIQALIAPENIPDKIVLACTHFPILRDEIRNALTDDIEILDSGAAIARRVQSLLVENTPQSPSHFLSSAQLEATLIDRLKLEGFAQFSQNWSPSRQSFT